MEPLFNYRQLKKRCFQETSSLMSEAGFVYEELGNYAHRDNGSKILGVAHCDTVNLGAKHFAIDSEQRVIYCTRLDDRLGVYALLDYLPLLGMNYDILLCDDEERGASTASNFITSKQYDWVFEIDRRGTQAVTYCYNSPAWVEALEKHFDIGSGSFSDISCLEHLGASAVNVGCGYYGEHSMESRAYVGEFTASMSKLASFYAENSDSHFAHSQRAKKSFSSFESVSESYSWWKDDDFTLKTKKKQKRGASLIGEIEETIRLWYPTLDDMISLELNESNGSVVIDFVGIRYRVWNCYDADVILASILEKH